MEQTLDNHDKPDEINPFVGPRPYSQDPQDQRLFFGRDRETDEITSLIFGHQLVLIYAPSGAGKTSIFNAQIIPTLKENGFNVLPVARVGGGTPSLGYSSSSSSDSNVLPTPNIYLLNAFHRLLPNIDSASITGGSLSSFLRNNPSLAKRNGNGELLPQVLIFDQLEEIFTYYPNERWQEQQQSFFEQISDALRENRLLRIVLIIREDYLAQLDPFVDILPERLRPRFRLERLSRDAAKEAIKGPITNAIKNLSEEEMRNIESEIDDLVNELLKMYVEASGGDIRQLEGDFVEPIQLQVVCSRWWHEREEASKRLGSKKTSLEELRNVDRALEDFYEDAILTASKQTGVPEGKIRTWFQEKLITSSGTRSILHRGQKTTGGIDNDVLQSLESKYLIRKEPRAGAFWYELTHDRLIKPITASNTKWKTANDRKKNRKVILTTALTAAATVSIVLIVLGPTINLFKLFPNTNQPQVTPVVENQSYYYHAVPVGGELPSSLAVNSNNSMIYVANSKSGKTSVINSTIAEGTRNRLLPTAIAVNIGPHRVAQDPNTAMIEGDIPVDIGLDTAPSSLAVNPNTNMIYVANNMSNTVSIINGTTNGVVENIDVGDGPTSVAVNPNTNMIYVANNMSNTTSVINGKTNSLMRNIDVGDGPISVDVNPNNSMIYVANYGENTVSVINGKTNSLMRNIDVGDGPTSVAVNPNTNMIYVANSKSIQFLL